MFRGLVVNAQRLVAEVSQHRSPDQVAMGIALGTSFGLVPTDNLASVTLLLAILFLPVNQLAAASAWCIAFVFAGFVCAVPDAIGSWILSWEGIRVALARWHTLPLAPWFRLNNSLVLGSLSIGVLMVAPNYITWRWFTRKAQRTIADWNIDEMIDDAAKYRKALAVARTKSSIGMRERASHSPQESTIEDHSPSPLSTTPPSPMAPWLEIPDRIPQRLPSDPLVEPKSQLPMGQVVRFDSANTFHEPETTTSEQDSQTMVRETFIEVVRLRVPNPNFSSSVAPGTSPMILDIPSSTVRDANDAANHQGVILPVAHSESSVTRRSEAAHQPLTGPKSSNSLRYLLKHLTSHRDTQDSSESCA